MFVYSEVFAIPSAEHRICRNAASTARKRIGRLEIERSRNYPLRM